MAKAKKAVKGMAVKKTWYPILAPKLFNEQVIGEILLADPLSAVGRTIPANLMNLTGDIKKQNVNIIFKITGAAGSKLNTEFTGYEMVPSSIRRMVRRGKKKIDYSFAAATSDGKYIRIKVIMVTKTNTTLSTLTALRRLCEQDMVGKISKMTFEEAVRELISYKLQMGLRKALNKVYPLRTIEFRVFRLEKRAKVAVLSKESPVEANEEEMIEDSDDMLKPASKKQPEEQENA